MVASKLAAARAVAQSQKDGTAKPETSGPTLKGGLSSLKKPDNAASLVPKTTGRETPAPVDNKLTTTGAPTTRPMTARGIKGKEEETKTTATTGDSSTGPKKTITSKLGTGLANKLKPAIKPVQQAEDPNNIKEDILNEEE